MKHLCVALVYIGAHFLYTQSHFSPREEEDSDEGDDRHAQYLLAFTACVKEKGRSQQMAGGQQREAACTQQ